MTKKRNYKIKYMPIILIFSFLFIGLLITCKKEHTLVLTGTSRITNGCGCQPPPEGLINNPCGNNTVKCVKHFFNNGTFTRYYTVNWYSGCAALTTSTMKICYNNNCKFQIQFSGLPFCLKDCCLQEDKCYETDNFACGNHNITINFEDTNCQGFAIGFTITGDLEITIHCVDASGTSFEVKGTLN